MRIRDKAKLRQYSKRHYEKNKDRMVERARAFNKKRSAELRLFVEKYLSDHPCIDCGESDVVVLDFDHRDPTEKAANVSDLVSQQKGTSFRRLKAEIEKCDVRCANCHRRKTHLDRLAKSALRIVGSNPTPATKFDKVSNTAQTQC